MKWNKRLWFLGFLYVVAFGFMLILDGIFLDDPILYGTDYLNVYVWNSMAGFPWNFVFVSVAKHMGIIGYHWFVFLGYIGVATCLNIFIQREYSDLREDGVLVCGLFALFPVFTERILAAAAWYTIPYFSFFCGLLILSYYLTYRNIAFRTASLILFLISFAHNSICFFYLLVPLYLHNKSFGFDFSFSKGLRTIKQYPDFLFLPVVAFTIQYLNRPFGFYQGYNAIGLKGLFLGIFGSIRAIFESFVLTSLYVFRWDFLLTSMIILFSVYRLLLSKENILEAVSSCTIEYNKRNNILLGLLMLFLAVYPYCVVGKTPSHVDWAGRWQLLMPLGAGVTLFFLIKTICEKLTLPRHCYKIVIWFFIIGFSLINADFYLQYHRDYFRQQSLFYHIQNSALIKEQSTFVFQDVDRHLNAKARLYRGYEYNFLMKNAFGDEKRLGYDVASIHDDHDSSSSNPSFFYREWTGGAAEYGVIISKGSYDISSNTEVLRMLHYRFFDIDKYQANLNNIVTISLIPADRVGEYRLSEDPDNRYWRLYGLMKKIAPLIKKYTSYNAENWQ